MFYQVAMEVIIVGDQEEARLRSIHRGPDLDLLLNRVTRSLQRKLGINLMNSVDSDNPAEADITLAVTAWTSYESFSRGEKPPTSSNPPTARPSGIDPGCGNA